MNRKEGFSVLVATYNNVNYIEDCLNSIQSQTYFKENNNYEILVGIDGCEKTLNKLKNLTNKHTNLKILNMEKNRGVYVTINTLLTISKYDKIIKFDSDDIMYPNLIEVINNEIGNNSVMMFPFTEFKDGDDLKNSRYAPAAHGVFCFKYNVLEKLGGFKNWVCAADTDFFYRLDKNHKVGRIGKPLFYRRLHPTSLTHDKKTNFTSELRMEYKKRLKRGVEFVVPTINKYEII